MKKNLCGSRHCYSDYPFAKVMQPATLLREVENFMTWVSE